MNKPSEIIRGIAESFMQVDEVTFPSFWEKAIIDYLDQRFEETQKIIKDSNK